MRHDLGWWKLYNQALGLAILSQGLVLIADANANLHRYTDGRVFAGFFFRALLAFVGKGRWEKVMK